MSGTLNAIRTVEPEGYRCPRCRYDLTGTPIEKGLFRCPECGASSRAVPEFEIRTAIPPRDLGPLHPPLEYPARELESRPVFCVGCSRTIGGPGIGPPAAVCQNCGMRQPDGVRIQEHAETVKAIARWVLQLGWPAWVASVLAAIAAFIHLYAAWATLGTGLLVSLAGLSMALRKLRHKPTDADLQAVAAARVWIPKRGLMRLESLGDSDILINIWLASNSPLLVCGCALALRI